MLFFTKGAWHIYIVCIQFVLASTDERDIPFKLLFFLKSCPNDLWLLLSITRCSRVLVIAEGTHNSYRNNNDWKPKFGKTKNSLNVCLLTGLHWKFSAGTTCIIWCTIYTIHAPVEFILNVLSSNLLVKFHLIL